MWRVPATFDEDEVVAAARDEFWERGYAATSVDDLTAATGLGKGSLYGAFGDKHSLYLRALDDYIALVTRTRSAPACATRTRAPMNGLRVISAGRPRRLPQTRTGAAA